MIDKLIAASALDVKKMGQKTCVVTITLISGFEITESASCVDPADYDEAIGKETCIKRIKDKLWFLMGYLAQTNVRTVDSTMYDQPEGASLA